MSRRLFFTYNRPANVDNHYVVGTGVGSKSRFVRSALRRRSSNNAQGKPCCSPMPKTIDEISPKTKEKNKCTGGMVWKECGSACTRKCSVPEPLCTKQCVQKCECPQGQVLEGGSCMEASMCGFSDVSCGALGGHYIKDSNGIPTKYCCTTWDGSGCTSSSKDDVCLNATSDNSGNDECLSLNDRFRNCSGETPSHYKCSIPDINNIQNGTYDKSNHVCVKYKDADGSDPRDISFLEIATAWKAAGNNMDFCPHALIIAGGECSQPGGTDNNGFCSIQGTGPSGIWQVDSARGKEYNLYNPCENARAVYNQIVRPVGSFDAGCYTQATATSDIITTSLRITGKPPGGAISGTFDYKYWDTGGDPSGNCNWFGPFCHWQSSFGVERNKCCAWTGGANEHQPQGFPYYYQRMFLNNKNGWNIDNFTCSNGKMPNECNKLQEKALKEAASICDQVL